MLATRLPPFWDPYSWWVYLGWYIVFFIGVFFVAAIYLLDWVSGDRRWGWKLLCWVEDFIR